MSNIDYRLSKFQSDLGKWSDSTFGKDRSPIGPLTHLQREVNELLENPDDIMEYADALMLIIDASRNAGFSIDMLLDAAELKLKVNKVRKWGPPDKDGVSEHIK